MSAVIDHEARSWTIPEDLQGRAIKLAFLKLSAKEIYELLFPKQPPVTQGTFTIALKLLIAGAEGEVRAIFRKARLPYSPPGSASSRASDNPSQGQDQELDPSLAPDDVSGADLDVDSDTDPDHYSEDDSSTSRRRIDPRTANAASDYSSTGSGSDHLDYGSSDRGTHSNSAPLPLVLGLGPEIEEDPLPGGIEAALQTFVKIRKSLENEIDFCESDPLPELPGKDARAVRAGALATLANAYTANVLAETRIAEVKLNRTIKRHTLRLDLIDEMEEGEAENIEPEPNSGRRPFPRPPIGSSLSSGGERITGRDILTRGRLGSGSSTNTQGQGQGGRDKKSKDGNLFVLRLPPSRASSPPPRPSTQPARSNNPAESAAAVSSAANSAALSAADPTNPSDLLGERSKLFDDEDSPF